MCTQGMAQDLLYVLQMSKPRAFQELATKARDMEVTIANRHGSSLSLAELKRDRVEVKKNVKCWKNSTKETMTVTKAELVRITGKPTRRRKESCTSKTR